MKAAVRSKYGTSNVLSILDIDMPTFSDNEILVRVHAATVSRTDCHVLTGLPIFMRLFTGLLKPRYSVTGTDFAGQIEATGKKVLDFKTGDKVIGFDFLGSSSHAQWLAISSDKISLMPQNINYKEAAACVEGGYYALSVINKLNPDSGQKALVVGATGAIGIAALQFFKSKGTNVSAVCGGENMEFIKSLGAAKAIDYKTDDFTRDSDRYDFIFDAVGKSSFGKCKHLLKEKGIYVSSGGPSPINLIRSSISGRKKEIFVPPKDLKGCLAFIKDLTEKGSFRPVVDKVYPIEKIGEAFDYAASGRKIGSAVIDLDL
jgi:NADPH:quinone reductase-like Zn-dependent oxidoreductase